jgi:hypothetical protein
MLKERLCVIMSAFGMTKDYLIPCQGATVGEEQSKMPHDAWLLVRLE